MDGELNGSTMPDVERLSEEDEVIEDEALDWDLDERDRFLDALEDSEHEPEITPEVVVGEDD